MWAFYSRTWKEKLKSIRHSQRYGQKEFRHDSQRYGQKEFRHVNSNKY